MDSTGVIFQGFTFRVWGLGFRLGLGFLPASVLAAVGVGFKVKGFRA